MFKSWPGDWREVLVIWNRSITWHHITIKIPVSNFFSVKYKPFAWLLLVAFSSVSFEKSSNTCFIIGYPHNNAFKASERADHLVSELFYNQIMGTLRTQCRSKKIPTMWQQKKVYTFSTNKKKFTASSLHSAAHFPTKFSECAKHVTNSAYEQISLTRDWRPLYFPLMLLALS